MTTSQTKKQSITRSKGRQSVSGGSAADRYRGVVERGVSDQAAIESHLDLAEAFRAADFVQTGAIPGQTHGCKPTTMTRGSATYMSAPNA